MIYLNLILSQNDYNIIIIIVMDSTQWQSFFKSCLDILRNGESKFE